MVAVQCFRLEQAFFPVEKGSTGMGGRNHGHKHGTQKQLHQHHNVWEMGSSFSDDLFDQDVHGGPENDLFHHLKSKVCDGGEYSAKVTHKFYSVMGGTTDDMISKDKMSKFQNSFWEGVAYTC